MADAQKSRSDIVQPTATRTRQKPTPLVHTASRHSSEPMKSPAYSSPGGISPTTSEDSQQDDPTVIPRSHDYRTLVLCFDGTGDSFDADNSNIVHFFSMLKKDDPSQQMVYYQAGIGTYTIPQIATPLMAKISKAIDMAVANNLNAHVMGGYEFLMQNYQAGDKICIFGFSRGAYTARALAGMVHKVGLLPTCNHQQVPFAYKMFTREDEVGWKQSRAFKKAFSVNVEIEFMGVWDTVASVGIFPRRLPFTTSNSSVRFFRHAISLDEHRAKFQSNHWHRSPPDAHSLGVAGEEMPRSNQQGGAPKTDPHHYHHHPGRHGRMPKTHSSRHFERQFDDGDWETDVLEVYFAGCHCDVGGGSVSNETRHSLARIPLRWMIRQCFLAGTGIQFHRSCFVKVGIHPDHLYPFVRPRQPALYASPSTVDRVVKQSKHELEPSNETLKDELEEDRALTPIVMEMTEEEEDLRDALSPIYDQLELSKGWWSLEVIPLKHRVQKDSLKWKKQY
ncbi:hypothetical protein OF83DRAFT_1170095, partial [Amylostereum chailletii]